MSGQTIGLEPVTYLLDLTDQHMHGLSLELFDRLSPRFVNDKFDNARKVSQSTTSQY